MNKEIPFRQKRIKFSPKIIAMIVVLIVISCIFAKYISHMCHLESYVKHLKCKRPFVPFFGNALSAFGKSSTELMLELIQFTAHNKTPVKAYFGPLLFVTLDNPEDVKTVLMSSHCLDRPYFFKFSPTPHGIFSERCKQYSKSQF